MARRRPTPASDRALIEALVLGDRDERGAAWRALIARFEPVLVAALRTASPAPFSHARAEECVAEFFQQTCLLAKLKAYLRHDPNEHRLDRYLVTAVRRFACREYLRCVGWHPAEPREGSRTGSLPSGAASAHQLACAKELHAELRRWFSARPIGDRCVMLLKIGPAILTPTDAEWVAMATHLGTSPATLRDRIRRLPDGQQAAALLGLPCTAYYKRVERLRKHLLRHLVERGFTGGILSASRAARPIPAGSHGRPTA